MKSNWRVFTILIVLFFTACQEKAIKKTNPSQDPIRYLKDHWMSPEAYVISKFDTHDYVFIGEYHRLKHDVDLILALIPKLYEKGIYNLGIEFGDYQDQHLVDSLLNLSHFDRLLAQRIMFNCSPDWGYEEYIDIYKVAWEINQSTAEGEEKFRVINLAAHYDPCKEGGAWKDIDPDAYMASTIFKEIISKNQPALIYAGNHHAFTRYHQPIYSFNKDSLLGFNTTRMGNIIYDSLEEKVFNIYLHSAWASNKGWSAPPVLPVNGQIDSIMNTLGNKPIGFDVLNSPFGGLKSTDSYYSLGYPGFTLASYCDGYIFQKSFKKYKMITMEENFITNDNIQDLKKYLSCRGVDQQLIDSISTFNIQTMMEEKAEDHFGELMN